MTLLFALLLAASQAAPTDLFRDLRWRSIGPLRGGRTKAATGVPSQPGVFYAGAVNGGVFRTDDYGRTWTPIFDDQPTASIGAIAVAPSRPDTIYVGSGEGLQRPDLSTGDGIYKSVDAGRTWRHLGLRDGQQIPQIAIDPRDPDRLFVAVLGHPYGPNEERGVFRSTDGGETFRKVLYADPDTGAADVLIDPADPRTVYAALWESREAPWENGHFEGPGSGLYKSADGGDTWRRLDRGLPAFAEDGLGRIGIGIAPSNPRRLFATVAADRKGGLYRSDDAGESWFRVTDDPRVAERADDFAEVKVHPRDPDVVFTASVAAWKSTDGGKTFSAFRGAPGGDDYHRIWIDPTRPDVLLLAGDQGVAITVNGGRTWSSWYNQPTAQMFHVTADDAFPYRLCGGQQESGSACVASRGADGAISFRDWRPAGVEEYGYAAPDPRDPDIVYGGRVTRHDRRTGQTQEVAPVPLPEPGYRVVRTQPILFSPADPATLYFASNVLWRTRDGGRSWARISPDLARKTWDVPANVGKYRGSKEAAPSQRGVIYAVAISPMDGRIIWAGTDDGLLHLTRDGGASWRDVTPPALHPWAKVSVLEASHFDPLTAYAAINTFRLDDLRPHVLRTHDGGATWSAIANGIPTGGIVNVVREDPRRKGLLYAGAEQGVYVSFDDGERWQSLRLNLPATSVRDLIVKDDDLAIATHGRGFWILDDVSPLRQTEALAARPALLRPARALRVRWNTNSDTPLPPDEPTGENPPDGAVLHYYLPAPVASVALEILDGHGRLVRQFSSADQAPPVRDEGNVPRWWIRPEPRLSAEAGLHRFVWDLHHAALPSLDPKYPIGAVPGNTPREPRGPWALPGRYVVKLTAGAGSWTQPLVVDMDPRVKTPAAGLRRQLELSEAVALALLGSFDALQGVRTLRARGVGGELAQALAELDGENEGRPRRRRARGEASALAPCNARLLQVYEQLQQADVDPTPQLALAARSTVDACGKLVARWKELARPR